MTTLSRMNSRTHKIKKVKFKVSKSKAELEADTPFQFSGDCGDDMSPLLYLDGEDLDYLCATDPAKPLSMIEAINLTTSMFSLSSGEVVPTCGDELMNTYNLQWTFASGVNLDDDSDDSIEDDTLKDHRDQ